MRCNYAYRAGISVSAWGYFIFNILKLSRLISVRASASFIRTDIHFIRTIKLELNYPLIAASSILFWTSSGLLIVVHGWKADCKSITILVVCLLGLSARKYFWNVILSTTTVAANSLTMFVLGATCVTNFDDERMLCVLYIVLCSVNNNYAVPYIRSVVNGP